MVSIEFSRNSFSMFERGVVVSWDLEFLCNSSVSVVEALSARSVHPENVASGGVAPILVSILHGYFRLAVPDQSEVLFYVKILLPNPS